MKTIDRAYLAGIIDGEGSVFAGVQLYSNDKIASITCIVDISNTDRRLVEWFKGLFPDLRAYYRPTKRGTSWKPVWHIRVHGQHAKVVLLAALPYLRLKRQQADLVLKLIDLKRNTGRAGYLPAEREQLMTWIAAVRQLNRKGVA